jgi:NAD-dependent SIR2 family protein deacetylase
MATPQSSISRPRYVLALLGAGLSAPSGLPTYAERAQWQGEPYEAFTGLTAFHDDPAKSWSFHENFRQLALSARPNIAHEAIARYAENNPDFLAITQNIDGK